MLNRCQCVRARSPHSSSHIQVLLVRKWTWNSVQSVHTARVCSGLFLASRMITLWSASQSWKDWSVHESVRICFLMLHCLTLDVAARGVADTQWPDVDKCSVIVRDKLYSLACKKWINVTSRILKKERRNNTMAMSCCEPTAFKRVCLNASDIRSGVTCLWCAPQFSMHAP